MKYNEAQQTERVSTSIGSIAFSAEILVLIALAKLAGPMLAVLWAGMIIWGVIADHRNVAALADAADESKATK